MSDRQSKLDDLFRRADSERDKGNLKSAFRLFMAAAKGGEVGCQVNLGNFYCHGEGVKPNRAKAMYWYRRAYRQGSMAAASNIALEYQREGKLKQALAWFERAVKLKDGDAHLEIAKIYIQTKKHKGMVIHHLKQTVKATYVLEESREEAHRLLKRLT